MDSRLFVLPTDTQTAVSYSYVFPNGYQCKISSLKTTLVSNSGSRKINIGLLATEDGHLVYSRIIDFEIAGSGTEYTIMFVNKGNEIPFSATNKDGVFVIPDVYFPKLEIAIGTTVPDAADVWISSGIFELLISESNPVITL